MFGPAWVLTQQAFTEWPVLHTCTHKRNPDIQGKHPPSLGDNLRHIQRCEKQPKLI